MSMFVAPATPAPEPVGQLSLFTPPGMAEPVPSRFAAPSRSVAPPATIRRPLLSITPTGEQAAILDAFTTGQRVVIEAGAGTGKTSTLKLLAGARPTQRGLYLAYNNTVVREATGKFPASCAVSTAHSLAYWAVGIHYAHRLPPRPGENRPNQAKRLPAHEVAKVLGLRSLDTGEHQLTGPALAKIADETVAQFCRSADPTINATHVPRPAGMAGTEHIRLANRILPAAMKMWTDLTDPAGVLYFQHDCQPAGTLVRRVIRSGGPGGARFEDVPIEQIREGDLVVSLSLRSRLGYVQRQGRRVTAAGSRPYLGDLIEISTSRGRHSRYTAEHRCVVRLDSDLSQGNYIVYLAQSGNRYRIGRTTWRTRSQGNALGLRRRAESQNADAMWILSVHETDADAAFAEAMISDKWGLPTWQFRSTNETMPLERFWSYIGNRRLQAAKCLLDHGRDIRYPFWQRYDGWRSTRRPIVMRALNLLPGMLVLEPDEIAPVAKGSLVAFDGSGGWAPIEVTRSRYQGTVYNLDVDVDHIYIADGIATHNCYLKMWQLTNPVLPYQYILFDEAQDADPVISHIVAAQDHAQLVYVGDRAQAIYGWRGAVDAMARFEGARLQLTQSFRFGPAIADEANQWLDLLGASLRLTGTERVSSSLGYVDDPDAILCRTNGGAIGEVIEELDRGQRVALVGDGKEIKRFAYAARDLMAKKTPSLPELAAFKSWADLVSYVEDERAGSDLKSMVNMVRKHGPSTLIDTVNRLTSQRQSPDVTVSTAHKAKGLEWSRVRVGGDFTPLKHGMAPEPEELRLAYVTATRPQHKLDLGSLSARRTGYLDALGVWHDPSQLNGWER